MTDLLAELLDEGPLTASELLSRVREAAPAFEIWEEALGHLLASNPALFRREGERWARRKGLPGPASEPKAQPAASLLPVAPRDEVAGDASEFLRLQAYSFEPHSSHEQKELAKRRDLARATGDWLAESEACWSLAWGSLRLAYWAVERFPRIQGLEQCDLVMAAVNGLHRAAEKWDPSRSTYSTYATHWARQSVSRVIADESRVVRVPAHAHELWVKIQSWRRRHSKNGRSPSLEEAAGALGIPRAKIEPIERASTSPVSLDLVRNIEEGSADNTAEPAVEASVRSYLSLNPMDGWVEELERCHIVHSVWGALARLDSQERSIVAQRYGLVGAKRTLEEVGRQLGVTREWIRQIEARALAALTPELSSRLGLPLPSPREKSKGSKE